MMKFKSLFRRGQQSHSSNQKQNRNQRSSHQQQVAAPQSQAQHQSAAASATIAVSEGKSKRSDWLSSSSTSLTYYDARSNGPTQQTSGKNQGTIQVYINQILILNLY